MKKFELSGVNELASGYHLPTAARLFYPRLGGSETLQLFWSVHLLVGRRHLDFGDGWLETSLVPRLRVLLPPGERVETFRGVKRKSTSRLSYELSLLSLRFLSGAAERVNVFCSHEQLVKMPRSCKIESPRDMISNCARPVHLLIPRTPGS